MSHVCRVQTPSCLAVSLPAGSLRSFTTPQPPAPMAQKCMGALISAASYPHGKNVQHIYFSWEFIISDGLAVLIGVKGDRGRYRGAIFDKSCLFIRYLYTWQHYITTKRQKSWGFFLLELQWLSKLISQQSDCCFSSINVTVCCFSTPFNIIWFWKVDKIKKNMFFKTFLWVF